MQWSGKTMELDVIYYFSHIPSRLVFPRFAGIAVGFCPLCPAQVRPQLQSWDWGRCPCPSLPTQTFHNSIKSNSAPSILIVAKQEEGKNSQEKFIRSQLPPGKSELTF